MNSQIRKLGLFIVVLFLVLFVQMNNIQVFSAAALNDRPENSRRVVADFRAPRGSIIASDGVVLANSVPSNDQYKYQRQYPTGDLFGNVTGFFSFNYGAEGVERSYNDELVGKKLRLQSLDNLLADQNTTNDITLTLSNRLQSVAKEALGKYKGAVVAIDPKTGGILAMYSNPSYDPSLLASHDFPAVADAYPKLIKSTDKPALPRGYRERYVPGSTFKVVTASAAYEHKADLVRKRYPTMQALPLPNSGGRSLRNFGGETCGGSLPSLLRVSCNSGFGQMGIDLGATNMINQAEAFGFNSQPPIDMPSAAKSAFPNQNFFRGNVPGLALSAIGQQNVSATPLQMAMVAGGIANGGVVMTPHVMKEVRNRQGEVVVEEPIKTWRRATSSETASKMTDNMIQVSANGTATGARIPGIEVGAKTGTAETTENRINAWLISFAPAKDPKIAVAVILEDQVGNSDATGGRLAAPIAKQVMSTYLSEDIPKSTPKVKKNR